MQLSSDRKLALSAFAIPPISTQNEGLFITREYMKPLAQMRLMRHFYHMAFTFLSFAPRHRIECYKWCRMTGEAELWVPLHYINVSALTTEQQHLLLQELHPVANDNREFTGLCFKTLLAGATMLHPLFTPDS